MQPCMPQVLDIEFITFFLLRTRWKFSSEAVVDMVNIHLFHDASNLISVESVPSIYVNYRKRALSYTLDRISNKLTNASNEATAATSTKRQCFRFEFQNAY